MGDWSEVNISLIIAIGTIVTAIGGFILAIFNNGELRKSIINLLIRKVKGRKFLTSDNLDHHDLILKLDQYIKIGQHVAESLISDPIRSELYRNYMVTICIVFLESINHMLEKNLLSMNDTELQQLLISQVAWRREQYNERFYKYLLNKNSDKNAASKVLYKIENWRALECDMITNNILSVISGKKYSTEYKLDIIFHQYNLGIDVLCKNGADSFEKLNGELNAFLKP